MVHKSARKFAFYASFVNDDLPSVPLARVISEVENRRNDMAPGQHTEIDLSFRFFVKVFAAFCLAFCLFKITPLIVLTLFSILIAVTLQPVRARLARLLPLWLSTTLIVLGLIGAMALIFGVLAPAVISQVAAVSQEWPKIKNDVFHAIPENSLIRNSLQRFISNPGIIISKELPQQLLTFGGMAIGGLSSLVLMLTLSVYFLIEGKRTVTWILAFFRPEVRFKLHLTMRELGEVISAYVGGQFITSLLVAVYVGAVLTILKVPAVVVLALLAGIFDVLPIIGFILSVLPATLLALTVSAKVAFIVFIAYVLYHAAENYFIVPIVYGNKLRLSTLAVLLALLAGAMIGGIPGAILSLPIAASYPIIERIWLRRYVGDDVVEKHSGGDESKKRIG
jgi:predicted PurR-regulated permease PerM